MNAPLPPAAPTPGPRVTTGVLFTEFLKVGLSGFGGVLPFARRMLVEQRRWLSDRDFNEVLTLSQFLPGPNIVNVSIIAGALVAMLSMCGPSSLLTYCVANVWDRFRDAPLRIAIQRALEPVTVGLVLSSGYVLTRMTDHAPPAYAITGATLLLSLTTRLHPLGMLAVAASAGALGFVE